MPGYVSCIYRTRYCASAPCYLATPVDWAPRHPPHQAVLAQLAPVLGQGGGVVAGHDQLAAVARAPVHPQLLQYRFRELVILTFVQYSTVVQVYRTDFLYICTVQNYLNICTPTASAVQVYSIVL